MLLGLVNTTACSVVPVRTGFPSSFCSAELCTVSAASLPSFLRISAAELSISGRRKAQQKREEPIHLFSREKKAFLDTYIAECASHHVSQDRVACPSCTNQLQRGFNKVMRGKDKAGEGHQNANQGTVSAEEGKCPLRQQNAGCGFPSLPFLTRLIPGHVPGSFLNISLPSFQCLRMSRTAK